MEHELAEWGDTIASELLFVEAIRACARYGPRFSADARDGLDEVTLVPLDQLVLDLAADLRPPLLGTLDAVHLATALSLGDDLNVLFSYDDRLLEAAREHGLTTASPVLAPVSRSGPPRAGRETS